MRKVILYIATSLDGYIARPNGNVDWLDVYNDVDYGYEAFIASVDCAILGRGTYEKSLAFGEEVFKAMPHYVFTHSDGLENWGAVQFIREEPAAFVGRLKQAAGRHIWMMGGGLLLNDFLAAGLVDEMMIFVIPQLLGEGIALFPGPVSGSQIPLIGTEKYSNGVVLLYYGKKGQRKNVSQRCQ